MHSSRRNLQEAGPRTNLPPKTTQYVRIIHEIKEATLSQEQLTIPDHYEPEKVERVWRVPYQERAEQAHAWARKHGIPPAAEDDFRIALVCIDVQNTFCLPDFELFVAGRSGTGAVDDNKRLCEFIYRNLNRISEITCTLDTHTATHIFHPVFLVNDDGQHPDPLTLVTAEDVEHGVWKFNPALASTLGITPEFGQRHLEHYTRQLKAREKFDLTVWPYHSMLGGIGHALVSAVEEAIFFHSIARNSQTNFNVKGRHPLTEHYSALGPEVTEGPDGKKLAEKDDAILLKVQEFNAVFIAGQAKSHCVAWTVDDLLTQIQKTDPSLAQKVYLVEDCCSPVVVPDVVDYTDSANAAFERFAEAGMNVVQSTQPLAVIL